MAIDPPSEKWLGFNCKNLKVRRSGLWNHKHVLQEQVDPAFLNKLEAAVANVEENIG